MILRCRAAPASTRPSEPDAGISLQAARPPRSSPRPLAHTGLILPVEWPCVYRVAIEPCGLDQFSLLRSCHLGHGRSPIGLRTCSRWITLTISSRFGLLGPA